MMRALAVAVCGAACMAAGYAGWPPRQPAAPATPQPRSAAAFCDSLGVNIHAGWPPHDTNGMAAELAYLGFHHVRDSVNGAKSGDAAARLAAFAGHGVRWDLIVPTTPYAYQTWLAANRQFIESLEGPNEADLGGGPVFEGFFGVPAAVAIQANISAMVHGTAALHGVKVLDYSLGHPDRIKPAPIESGYYDFRNLHIYASAGLPPRDILQRGLARARADGAQPVLVTETGYTTVAYNKVSAKGGHEGVDETTQAKYLLDAVFDDFSLGAAKTFLYDLRDDRDDPANTNKEFHFGLFHYDGTPKPAAVAFHNLLSILNDGSTGRPVGQAGVTVAAPGRDQVYRLLLEKSDGIFCLVLWTEPKLWAAHHAIAAPAQGVTLHFTKPVQSTATYDPMTGATPTAITDSVRDMTVLVPDHPIILRIDLSHPS